MVIDVPDDLPLTKLIREFMAGAEVLENDRVKQATFMSILGGAVMDLEERIARIERCVADGGA